jgi:hypothetical protein
VLALFDCCGLASSALHYFGKRTERRVDGARSGLDDGLEQILFNGRIRFLRLGLVPRRARRIGWRSPAGYET